MSAPEAAGARTSGGRIGTREAPIVFLHIPKTAGQTIHNELARVVGESAVSPVRVHSQAGGDAPQMPPGHALYSGHLDWAGMDALPAARFAFTVLRDPFERIASFYFYLLKQAQGLSEAELARPARTGMRNIRAVSADDYFFGGDTGWRRFVHDHYDNFYCTYLATGRMRGWTGIRDLEPEALLARAQSGAGRLDRIYATESRETGLDALERDIARLTGRTIRVTGNYVNAGPFGTDPQARTERRWPRLLERLESDASVRRLEGFALKDETLMERLGV